MSGRMRIGVVLAAACLVGLGLRLAARAEDRPAPAPDETAVRAVLQDHDRAFGQQNLQGVMELYAKGRPVLMGTGPGERYVGQEEIAGAYREFFKDFDKGACKIETTWSQAEVKGGVAWVAAMCYCTYFLKNEKREFGLNISVVLVHEEGKWRIAMMHYSNLTGPE